MKKIKKKIREFYYQNENKNRKYKYLCADAK